MVGVRGFEPPTTCTPCRCATRLRYTPIRERHIIPSQKEKRAKGPRSLQERSPDREAFGEFHRFAAKAAPTLGVSFPVAHALPAQTFLRRPQGEKGWSMSCRICDS